MSQSSQLSKFAKSESSFSEFPVVLFSLGLKLFDTLLFSKLLGISTSANSILNFSCRS